MYTNLAQDYTLKQHLKRMMEIGMEMEKRTSMMNVQLLRMDLCLSDQALIG